MFPIIIPIGIGVLGLIAARVARPRSTTRASGRVMPRNMSGTYLHRLGQMMRANRVPDDRLVECAMYEAIQQGRPDLAEALSAKFFGTELDDNDEQETTDQDIDQPKETITVSGKSSPIAGIDNSSWETFVSKLATDAPTFGTEKYIGMYHQRRDRLEELGLLNAMKPDDLDAQYAALVADLVDAHGKAHEVIKDHLASVVTVNGQECPVTLSGILGLLKAAGVKHARSWLENAKDRSQFPQTTNVFLATNGVF